MNNLIGTIALAIMLLLLLPAKNSSSQTSPEGNLYLAKVAKASANVKGAQSNAQPGQSELCPTLLELPIMLGRPAPCTHNYSVNK